MVHVFQPLNLTQIIVLQFKNFNFGQGLHVLHFVDAIVPQMQIQDIGHFFKISQMCNFLVFKGNEGDFGVDKSLSWFHLHAGALAE